MNLIQTSIGKLKYDYIIFAAGTTTNYFGNRHVENVAIPMKNISEAMGLRNALLANFERAVTCATEEEKQELLNIVIVGGGATGVEVAGAIAEMKKYILLKDYPEMDSSNLNVYLIEATGRVLSVMSEESLKNAYKFLKQMGVSIWLNEKVVGYENKKVILESGKIIPSRSFIWLSGVKGVSVGNMNPSVIGRGGRILVDNINKVEGYDNIFAIGDQCLQTNDERYPNGHPQVAQVAIQQAIQLANNLTNMEIGKGEMIPFRYKDLGSMATIGRNKAVVEMGNVKVKGWFAWLMWLLVHLRPIIGVRNKLVIIFNWFWNYITYGFSLRLIVYARKAKEISEREEREKNTHLGEDILNKIKY